MKTLAKLGAGILATLMLTAVPAHSGPGNGATPQWEYGSFHVDGNFFIPCLGEEVNFFGEVPHKRHTITSPSGNTSYHFQILPVTPKGPQFTGIGNLSGTVWHFQNGLAANESFHLGKGEVFHLQSRENYVSEDGDRLTIVLRIHFTTNANGDLVVSRELLEWTCR